MAWTPLLEGPDFSVAREWIAAIGDALTEMPPPDYSLAGGDSGTALFLARAEEAGLGARYGEASRARFERAAEALSEAELDFTLYSGFTGAAFANQLVHAHGLATGRGVENLEEDPNEEIDAALEELLGAESWHGHFDLVSGLAGFGAYASLRLSYPSGPRILERVVALLGAEAVAVPGGKAWLTPTPYLPPWRGQGAEGFDLGVAHGLGGVIGVLVTAVNSGVAGSLSKALLEGALGALEAAARSSPPGTLPSMGGNAPVGTEPARSGWCYGAVGMAPVLVGAGRALNEPRLEAWGLRLAREALEIPFEKSGVRDACLCHGALGNALIYQRLWALSGDPRLRQGAIDWFRKGFAMRGPAGARFGGVTQWNAQLTPAADDPCPGLLMGAAGVGLALLAATTDAPPDWDRFLLVS